jgi:hypothetical protein
MSTTKRIAGDYNIVSVDIADGDNVNVITHTVNIVGNLNVSGNVTYIDVTELTVDDPFITVAANNSGSGAGAAFPEQGLVTQTGTGTFAGLRFNNPTNTWQISPSVTADGAPLTAYSDLASAAATSPGLPTNSVQFNAGNIFGGSANLLFDSANARLTLTGTQVLANIGTAPAAVANSVSVYHNAVGAGGSGVYAKTTATDGELVSKSRAIVFGLIL